MVGIFPTDSDSERDYPTVVTIFFLPPSTSPRSGTAVLPGLVEFPQMSQVPPGIALVPKTLQLKTETESLQDRDRRRLPRLLPKKVSAPAGRAPRSQVLFVRVNIESMPLLRVSDTQVALSGMAFCKPAGGPPFSRQLESAHPRHSSSRRTQGLPGPQRGRGAAGPSERLLADRARVPIIPLL